MQDSINKTKIRIIVHYLKIKQGNFNFLLEYEILLKTWKTIFRIFNLTWYFASNSQNNSVLVIFQSIVSWLIVKRLPRNLHIIKILKALFIKSEKIFILHDHLVINPEKVSSFLKKVMYNYTNYRLIYRILQQL